MKREKPMSRNRTMDMHSTEYAHSMARGEVPRDMRTPKALRPFVNGMPAD